MWDTLYTRIVRTEPRVQNTLPPAPEELVVWVPPPPRLEASCSIVVRADVFTLHLMFWAIRLMFDGVEIPLAI